ncbi:MAG: PQQ-binding-like beta-propeller repeat protein [Planctomycetota bacterium]|nr:PQQ-binding-like beta-propeller repeat protein [Planctomycetota bacterium]
MHARLLIPFLLTAPLIAQDEQPTPAELQAEREAAFAAKMSGAILAGQFTDRTRPDAEPAADRYTLGEVKQLESGKWRFEAKIEYMGRTGTVPLEIDVFWAGDTPVITLTDFKVPLFGTFTSRVMVFEDEYVGLWDGAGHGGKMWGDIIRPQDEAPAEEDDGKTVHWPSYHGPSNGGGYARGETVAEWDVETGKNILWRQELPGLALSSPVIWGDRIFLTNAIRKEGDAELIVGLYGAVQPVPNEGPHEFRVICLDKRTGEVAWDELAWEGEPEFLRHTKGSYAASTPATDGKRVVAFFGSEGLYCYSVEGDLLWSKDFGSLDSGWYVSKDAQWGFASSPILHGDKVIVQVDVQEGSFVAALDADTGERIWKTPRADVPTWCTPTVVEGEERSMVVLNGYRHPGGYDLETGEPIWWLSGGGDIPVPRPVVANDLIYLTSAHGPDAPLYAVPVSAEGELTLDEEHVAWVQDRGNYMQTPVVIGERIFSCRDQGILYCRDALTGEERYVERIGGGKMGFTASLVACGDKLYATGEAGEVHVMRVADTFERLAINQMNEECMASPAISEDVLYIRGRHHLTAIGAKE